MTYPLVRTLCTAFGLSLIATTSAWACAPAATGKAKTASAPKARTFTSVPQKHNGSGIEIAFATPSTLQPGQPGTLVLRLSHVTGADAAVELRVESPEVQLSIDGRTPGSPLPLAAGQVRTLNLQVTAPEGMHYLSVFTRQNGRSSASQIALPVGQAKPVLKPHGKVDTMPSGEKVISLPSQ